MNKSKKPSLFGPDDEIDYLLEILKRINGVKMKFTNAEMKMLRKTKIYKLVKEIL